MAIESYFYYLSVWIESFECWIVFDWWILGDESSFINLRKVITENDDVGECEIRTISQIEIYGHENHEKYAYTVTRANGTCAQILLSLLFHFRESGLYRLVMNKPRSFRLTFRLRNNNCTFKCWPIHSLVLFIRWFQFMMCWLRWKQFWSVWRNHRLTSRTFMWLNMVSSFDDWITTTSFWIVSWWSIRWYRCAISSSRSSKLFYCWRNQWILKAMQFKFNLTNWSDLKMIWDL